MIEALFILIASTILTSAAGGSFPYSYLLNKKGAVDDQGREKGGVLPFNGTWLPEALLACVVGYALYHINAIYALFGIIWFYLWFQSGHANALSWGVNANPKRKNTLTPIVDFIYRGGFGRMYSAAFFSVKGFIMTLPFGGFGALYWPLAYDIGAYLEQRKGWDNGKAHKISEVLSGVFLGIHLGVLLWVMTKI